MRISPARSVGRALLRAACATLPLAVSAQEARFQDPDRPPPTASTVLAKRSAAVGELSGKTSLRVSGTVSGGGISPGTRFSRYTDREGRVVQTISNGTAAESVDWWDGRAAHRTINGRPTALTTAQAAAIRERGLAFGGLHGVDVQSSAVSLEWSDFFKCTCVKLRVSPYAGNTREEMYDPVSGMWRGIVRNGKDVDGKKEDLLIVFLAYRPFDRVQLPVDILEADGKLERRLKVDSVTWNAPLPAPLATVRNP